MCGERLTEDVGAILCADCFHFVNSTSLDSPEMEVTGSMPSSGSFNTIIAYLLPVTVRFSKLYP
jgi:hypothetical protein